MIISELSNISQNLKKIDIGKKLKEISNSYSPLPTKCIQELISSSEIRIFNEGEIVIREGQYSKETYLIFEGSARAYYLKDGKDISDWFTFEKQFPVVGNY